MPDAAFIKINNPMGENEEIIRGYVEAGYIIRTRADGDLIEPRQGDTTRLEAALRSGAQFISTDFPAPGRWGYQAVLPGAENLPARCNPVNVKVKCDPGLLE